VALICRRWETFALEDVPQMPTTVGADNLGSRHAQGAVLMTSDRAWDAVKVRWPSTARLEFVVGLVQWCFTACACVDTLLWIVLVELSRAWWLGALFPEDAELF
jgi:hypothetical protein